MAIKLETHPHLADASRVVQFWRAFVSGYDPSFATRVRTCYVVSVDLLEALSAWLDYYYAGANAELRKTLDSIRGQLERLNDELSHVGDAIAKTVDTSALWLAAAMPLAFGPAPIVGRLVSVRNQLDLVTQPPGITITTSHGLGVSLPVLSKLHTPAWLGSIAPTLPVEDAQADGLFQWTGDTAVDVATAIGDANVGDQAKAAWDAIWDALAKLKTGAVKVGTAALWIGGGLLAYKALKS